MDGGDLVDTSVDDPTFEADDERHGDAVDGHAGEVGWPSRRSAECGEGAGSPPILVGDLRRREAVVVRGRTEASLDRLAVERGLVLAGEDRTGDRMVGEHDRCAAPGRIASTVAVELGGENRVTEGKPCQECPEDAWRHLDEGTRHVDRTGEHAKVRCRATLRKADLDENVPAGDPRRVR